MLKYDTPRRQRQLPSDSGQSQPPAQHLEVFNDIGGRPDLAFDFDHVTLHTNLCLVSVGAGETDSRYKEEQAIGVPYRSVLGSPHEVDYCGIHYCVIELRSLIVLHEQHYCANGTYRV